MRVSVRNYINIFLVAVGVILICANEALAQISIDTSASTANSSAILDISSQGKGMLIPRMSSTDRTAIANPAQGLMVFDLDENTVFVYDGTAWSEVAELPSSINDSDQDTELRIEELVNGDQIVGEVLGEESMLINSEAMYLDKDAYIGLEGVSASSELVEEFFLSGASAIVNNFDDWQSFTAGINARLDYIQVFYVEGAPTGSVEFTVHRGEGDSGEVLATATLSSFTINDWNTISFADANVFLKKGDKYTLKFDRRWRIALNSTNQYAEGRAGSSDVRDYYFKVYGFASNYTFSIENGVVTKGNYETETSILESRVSATETILSEAEERINIIEDLIPVGTIQMWPTSSPPSGWLICDGSSFNATTYSELSTLLGGSVLPNFSGRFPLGVGNSGTNGSTNHTLFSVGGFEEHALTIAEMPSHNHQINYRGRSKDGSGNSVADLTSSGDTDATESTGGGQEHNNMPPYYTLNFIIKAN